MKDNPYGILAVTLASMLVFPKTNPEPEVLTAQKADASVIYGTVVKAWNIEGSTDTFFEAWISTEHRDKQKDIVPPEAFTDVIDEYMGTSGPLSYEHDMEQLPIGHIQKAALVRDGKIFKEASHPTDPADFLHFPGTGTGVYGRGVVNEPSHARAIVKANVGGMSWTGDFEGVRLPDGGRKFTKVTVWAESTIAAYPVNPRARIVASN